MNYFDRLPCEIVDYIYELRHKSMLNNVNDEIKENHLFNVEHDYEQIYIFVTIIIDGQPRRILYVSFKEWQFCVRKKDIINHYKLAKDDLKKTFLEYAKYNHVAIYKSWNKSKIVNYLFKHELIDEYIIYSEYCLNTPHIYILR